MIKLLFWLLEIAAAFMGFIGGAILVEDVFEITSWIKYLITLPITIIVYNLPFGTFILIGLFLFKLKLTIIPIIAILVAMIALRLSLLTMAKSVNK